MLVDLYMNSSYKGSAPSHMPVYHGDPMKGIIWKIVRKDGLIYYFTHSENIRVIFTLEDLR